MQSEIVKNISNLKQKQYLRIAAIGSRSNYCFLYIGSDSNTTRFLSENFTSGNVSDNFSDAKNILENKSAVTDIIILDFIPEEAALKDFHSFIHNRGLNSIPIVLNYSNQNNNNLQYSSQIIDDVIDLNNWQYDFATKISFLKKVKGYKYNRIQAEKKQKIRKNRINDAIKRLLDIIIASILLFLLLPLLLIIAISIRIESRGPVFYNSKRAGRGFRIFNFYKFRTMCVNADKKIESLTHLNQYNDLDKAVFFKISNDPRITRVGKFLRNTSLDELPQLFNVIKGDMSLVGNRPLPLYEAATLTTNEFVERFMAPAGMTGLWQIKKRGQSNISAEERISLDISYARNSNLLYDFWIIANTPGALIQKSNV